MDQKNGLVCRKNLEELLGLEQQRPPQASHFAALEEEKRGKMNLGLPSWTTEGGNERQAWNDLQSSHLISQEGLQHYIVSVDIVEERQADGLATAAVIVRGHYSCRQSPL